MPLPIDKKRHLTELPLLIFQAHIACWICHVTLLIIVHCRDIEGRVSQSLLIRSLFIINLFLKLINSLLLIIEEICIFFTQLFLFFKPKLVGFSTVLYKRSAAEVSKGQFPLPL